MFPGFHVKIDRQFFLYEFNVTSLSFINKPPDHYFSPAVCQECYANKLLSILLLDDVELFGDSGVYGIGDAKGPGPVEGAGRIRRPVCQRRGKVGRGQHIVSAVGRAARAAEDQVAA